MGLQEWAVAIGLLTPLVLGILAFIEKFIHRKKEPEKEEPPLVQGMMVATDSYADRLIKTLERELEDSNNSRVRAEQTIEVLRAELRGQKERNDNGN